MNKIILGTLGIAFSVLTTQSVLSASSGSRHSLDKNLGVVSLEGEVLGASRESLSGSQTSSGKYAAFFEAKLCEAMSSFQRIVNKTGEPSSAITCQVVSSQDRLNTVTAMNPNGWDYTTASFQALICAESLQGRPYGGREPTAEQKGEQIIVYRASPRGALLPQSSEMNRSPALAGDFQEAFLDVTQLSLEGIESAQYTQQIQIGGHHGRVCESQQALTHQCGRIGKICAEIVSVQ